MTTDRRKPEMVNFIFAVCCLCTLLSCVQVKAQSFDTNEGNVNPYFIFPGSEVFLWSSSSWSDCGFLKSDECCQDRCYRTRQIHCIRAEDGIRVPTYYCQKLGQNDKPESSQRCSNCSEDCVTSAWSRWSDCSATCGQATTFRSRRILRLAVNKGKACGELSEFNACSSLTPCPEPIYTWKIGPWTSCRKINGSSHGSNSTCFVGQRSRSVACLDDKGQEVNQSLCIQSAAGRRKPANTEACDLPCDCIVSDWGQWSMCSKTCHDDRTPEDGVQSRTRSIVILPEYGGLPCKPLIEKQHCRTSNLPKCPHYKWQTEEWAECQLLKSNDVCGAGQQRRQVYCVREEDKDLQPVDDSFCLKKLSANSTNQKPPSKRACQVPCPQDCQVGKWQNWSPCSKSCGYGGQKVRRREVLVSAAHGGLDCGPLTQTTKCEPVDCVWWHTGRWSKCFVDYGHGDCGPGSQVRVLYCKSSMGEVLEPHNCSHLEQPTRTKTCRVPCPSDCVVSEWTEWGPCSRSCGKRGGVQSRTRHILAFADPTQSSCLPEDELFQTRVCNEEIWCRNYVWQVGPWEDCLAYDQGQCGEQIGMQARSVTCERDTGVPVEEYHCDLASKPAHSHTCNVSCPVDCVLSVWSDWSECSQTCGEAYKYKSRRILQLPAFGGAVCPNDADVNGVIVKTKKCKDLTPCYTYQWEVLPWNECTVLNDQCGPGYQTRDVFCQQSNGIRLDQVVCLEKLLIARPTSYQRCFIPCGGDCVLSDWSDWTQCSKTCGDTPGVMTRSRHITSTELLHNLRQQCPHITDNDLMEIKTCPTVMCPSYSWDVGTWRSCILHHDGNSQAGTRVCGNGVQRRSVLCLRNDGQHIPKHHCDSVSLMPDVHRPCTIACPTDCQVSDWVDTSHCSHKCGTGMKLKTSRVLTAPAHGGRKCPAVLSQTVCLEKPCDQFEWQTSKWSTCTVEGTSNCGVGIQTRDVFCPAGDMYENECELRNPKPETERQCDLPCPGDCVLSTWSEFSDCSAACPVGGVKSRSREVIRLPSSEGKPCGEVVEFIACNKEPCTRHNYTVVMGEWSDCLLIAGDCGKGYKQRSINCVREDGLTVTPGNCAELDLTQSIMSCDIVCSEDCILSSYSDWSECSHKCGLNGVKTRSRSIENPAKNLGRQCPEDLTQTMPCNVKPCYTYDWYRSEWGTCSVDNKGCGHGEQSRTVECRRSDGRTVDQIYCVLQGDVDDIGDLVDLQKVISSLNKTEMDLQTVRVCGSLCPGDCQLSGWSDFGPCFKTCTSSNAGWKVRSRYITHRQIEGGRPCPENRVEFKSCDSSESLCPNFLWDTGVWDPDSGLRQVWCQSTELGMNITGGCPKLTKPTETIECNPLCQEPYTECKDGVCHCEDGFEGYNQRCFPVDGCKKNDHCLFENSFCGQKGTCECEDGFLLLNGIGPCVKSQAKTTHTGLPNYIVPVEKDVLPSAKEQKSDIWKYIALAVGGCVAILVIVILAVILLVRRNRSGHAEITTTATTVDFKHNNFGTNHDKKLKEKLSNVGKDSISTKC
ncbi:thrombospondin type-1 domain-containing protein 7A-like [Glandiceps talaboti]